MTPARACRVPYESRLVLAAILLATWPRTGEAVMNRHLALVGA